MKIRNLLGLWSLSKWNLFINILLRSGEFYFLLCVIIGSLNDLNNKLLLQEHNLTPIEVTFSRYLFATITILPFIIYKKTKLDFQYLKLYILRGALLCIAISLWMYEIKTLPLSVVTLISYLIPAFVIIASKIYLKEKIKRIYYFICILGVAGSIVAVNPNFSDAKIIPLSIFFISAMIFAILDIINKITFKNTNAAEILFFTNVIAATFALIFIVIDNKTINFDFLNYSTIAQIFLLGIGNNALVFCLLKALFLGNLYHIESLRYGELLLSVLFGYFLFNEVPTLSFYMGGVLIVIAMICLYKVKK